MSVYFIATNDLEQLAERLSENITGGTNIFSAPCIITQTAGMNQWLRRKIAEQIGIAANINFVQPADFISQVHRILNEPAQPKIAKQNLDLLIYQVISKPEFQQKYKQVAQYFTANDIVNDVKKWELAAALADLFDQYQIYRNDVLQKWSSAENVDDAHRKFEWQFYIWKEMKSLLGDSIEDMSKIKEDIITALKQPEKVAKLKKKFPNVALFGISIFTTFHMEIFHRLYQHIDFHFYISDPAPEFFWHYDQSQKKLLNKPPEERGNAGNNLLTSWGALIQNTTQILFQDEAILNAQTEVEHRVPTGLTLLSKIQEDIFHNRVSDINYKAELLKDRSIKIVSVYNIQTEVEALYNYLLQTFSEEKIPNLKENEVLVITPEIDKYAPYIKAVFDQAPYKFNYTISDETIAQTDSMAQAMLRILETKPFDFNAKTILEILDSWHIQKKFGLEDNLWLRQAIVTSGFRFGQKNDIDNETYLFSWDTAMQRLMYSYCIDGEDILEKDGKKFITTNNLESGADLRQIAALTSFGRKLIGNFSEQSKKKNLVGWSDYLKNLLQEFFFVEEKEIDGNINSFLNEMTKLVNTEGFEDNLEIPYDVFVQRLKKNLQLVTKKKNFLGHGITFCSPQPFRSIPFRVIAFVGLGFDNFPRRSQHLDFDLMQTQPRLGDRNVRDNDRHLFLESILAAKDALYLSYLGKDARSNVMIPPSVVLDELLDYIQTGTDIDVRKELIEHRPLHSFSTSYNKRESGLMPNYFIKKEQEFPIQLQRNENANSPTNVLEYSVKEICDAVCRSTKFYCQRTLGLYFPSESLNTPTSESFGLNTLDVYKLNKILLKNNEDKAEKLIQQATLRGELPLKNIREVLLTNHLKETKELLQTIRNDHPDFDILPVDFTIDVGDKKIRIYGSVEHASINGLVGVSFSDSKDKDIVQHYIHYLIYLAAQNESKPSYFYCPGKSKKRILALEEAKQRMVDLLKYVQECAQTPRWMHVSGKLDNQSALPTIEKYADEYNDMYYSTMLRHFPTNSAEQDYQTFKEKIYTPAFNLIWTD